MDYFDSMNNTQEQPYEQSPNFVLPSRRKTSFHLVSSPESLSNYSDLQLFSDGSVLCTPNYSYANLNSNSPPYSTTTHSVSYPDMKSQYCYNNVRHDSNNSEISLANTFKHVSLDEIASSSSSTIPANQNHYYIQSNMVNQDNDSIIRANQNYDKLLTLDDPTTLLILDTSSAAKPVYTNKHNHHILESELESDQDIDLEAKIDTEHTINYFAKTGSEQPNTIASPPIQTTQLSHIPAPIIPIPTPQIDETQLINIPHNKKINKPPTLKTENTEPVVVEFHESTFAINEQDKKHICKTCNRSFDSSSNLTSHIRCHLDRTEQISCQFCDKRFKRRNDLERHKFTHHFKLKLVCSGEINGQHWGCGMQYSRRDALVKHWNGRGKKCLANFKKLHGLPENMNVKDVRVKALGNIVQIHE